MQLSLLKEALKDVFGLPDAVLNRIIDGCDFSDFWITWYRLWQVYSNVAANGGSDADPNSPDDKDNLKSHYNHFNQAHHELLVKSLVGLNIFSFVVKTIQTIYRAYRERQLNSFLYLEQQLPKDLIEQDGKNSITKILNRLLAKKIAHGKNFEIDLKSKDQIKLKEISLASDADKNNIENKKEAKDSTQKDLSKESSTKTVQNFINQIRTSAFGEFTKKLWEVANGQALIFWIVWMIFNVAYGSKVIDPTPPSGVVSILKPVIATMRWLLTPIILGITIGAMLIYGIAKGIYQIYQRYISKTKENEQPTIGNILTSFFAIPVAPFILGISIIATAGYSIYKVVANIKHRQKEPQYQKIARHEKIMEKEKSILSELKARYFKKMRHAHFKSILKSAFETPEENKDTSLDKNKSEIEKKDSQNSDIDEKDKIENQKQKLKNHIFGGVHEQRFSLVNHSVREGVKGFIGASFVLWWASYIVSVAATHVGALAFLTGTAVILTNPILAGIIGLAFAGIFVGKGIAKFRQDRANYETERNEQLNAHYKNIDNSKFDYYTKLAIALDAKKVNINNLRTEVDKQVVVHNETNFEKLNAKDWKVSSYEPSTFLNVRTIFNYIAKGLGYILEFLGGAQTGNFLARALFLTGSLIFGAASSLANPVIGFFIIAGALSLIIGGNRLADFILKRRQQQQKDFNIDVEISHSKKMLKETDAMEKILLENRKSLEIANEQKIMPTSNAKDRQKDVNSSSSAATEHGKTAIYSSVFNEVKNQNLISIDARAKQLKTLRFA